jgi:hypothetical protein
VLGAVLDGDRHSVVWAGEHKSKWTLLLQIFRDSTTKFGLDYLGIELCQTCYSEYLGIAK